MWKGEAVLFGPEQKPWLETLSPFARSPKGKLLISPPSKALLQQRADEIKGITPSLYQVPSTGLTPQQQSQAHQETQQHLQHYATFRLGYQDNAYLDYTAAAMPYLNLGGSMNNYGDPNFESRAGCNTKWMERNVLDYYASLWHANWPHDPEDPDSYWGYVLSMGSTEGNLFALYTAREYLSGEATADDSRSSESPQLHLQAGDANALTPVAFFSQESHNSVKKALKILRISSFCDVASQKYPDENPLGGPWPKQVPSAGGDAGPGSIDINALTKLVDFFTAKGHPIIVIFNYGTTFKGAYDDVKAAGEALIPILKKNNMHTRKLFCNRDDPEQCSIRQGFWFHVDGALGASYMPFTKMAQEHGLINEEPGPTFDFQLEFVSSIVTSGHKWSGAPYPCGILLIRSRLRALPMSEDQYVGLRETTFGGSRNGLTAVLLWSYISTHSYKTQVKMAVHCVKMAQYTVTNLKKLEEDLQQDLWVSRSPASLAVIFKKPCADVCYKYTLPPRVLKIGGQERQLVHVYLMPSVTRKMIDELIHDLKKPGAFPDS